MSEGRNEKAVREIIEYANSEIKKSRRKHLIALLSILLGIAALTTVLILVFAWEGGYDMCLFLGVTAIVTAMLNVTWTLRRREAKWFRFISLAFTTLTVCSFYALAKQWALTGAEDQLLDVMPTLSDCLWFLSIVSIVINGRSLLIKNDR